MKQFMCFRNNESYDKVYGEPLDEGLALAAVSTATDSLLVQWCPVGRAFVDSDGFMWVRMEDVP